MTSLAVAAVFVVGVKVDPNVGVVGVLPRALLSARWLPACSAGALYVAFGSGDVFAVVSVSVAKSMAGSSVWKPSAGFAVIVATISGPGAKGSLSTYLRHCVMLPANVQNPVLLPPGRSSAVSRLATIIRSA